MARIIARRNSPIATPLTIIRGDTSVFDLTLVGTDGVTPVNLTGSQIYFSAKWSLTEPSGAPAISASTLTGGIAIITPAAGIITVTLIPALTNTLTNDKIELFYDLRQSKSSTEAYTALRGILTILPSVTTL